MENRDVHPSSVADRPMPPVLGRLMRGTFWLAVKMPLQVVIAFWSVPLVQRAIGADLNGAYQFAWAFGFLQMLLDFGMGSALQRQLSLAWTRGERDVAARLLAGGLVFYLSAALVQAAALLAIAYLGLPARFQGESRRLIVGLLWLQAASAPLFGLLTVASSLLQAARRYELIPVADLAVLVLRFAILLAGLRAGVDFFTIVVAQTAVHALGLLLPSLWVWASEIRLRPRLAGLGRDEWGTLLRIGFFTFLMQVSVVLADRVDTTILGYALPGDDAGGWITVYQNVSRPFYQIRQTAWTLAYLVMPAVAGLAAAHDLAGLDRLKYDGTRLLTAVLTPVTLLAAVYAAPFLTLWVGPRYAPHAPLLRLFLVAALPLMFSVLAQVAIGLGKIEVVALSTFLGSLVNLPLSYYLTTRLGVSGVIWGTVLTTLISNFAIPAAYFSRALDVRPSAFLNRVLSAPLAGAALMLPAAWAFSRLVPPDPVGPTLLVRALPLLANLAIGIAAYALGYVASPWGRRDFSALLRKLRPQPASGG